MGHPGGPRLPFEHPAIPILADAIATAYRNGKSVIFLCGGHVLRAGNGPLLIDLMQRGILTNLGFNGAGAIHDFELCCLGHEDVVVGITASRRTPYVLGGLSYAKSHGCYTSLIICNEFDGKSMGYEEASAQPDVIISLPVGPEVLTGSTRLKAGTATKLALNMITTAAWVRMGKCYGNLMVDLRMGSQKLQARARRILMEITGCDYEWADELLTEAHGELKTALVMHFRGVTAEHARERLEMVGGLLKLAVSDTLASKDY